MGRSALGVNQLDLPGGLPRDAPRASRASSASGGKGMLPPGYRVVGLRQVDGIPHNSQRHKIILDRQLTARHHDLRHAPHWPPGARARARIGRNYS
jgi:hypothetical protein